MRPRLLSLWLKYFQQLFFVRGVIIGEENAELLLPCNCEGGKYRASSPGPDHVIVFVCVPGLKIASVNWREGLETYFGVGRFPSN